MKKTILLFSAIVLFAGMTFGQTPKTQDKATPAPKAQTTTATPAKDTKAGCDKKDMEKCSKLKNNNLLIRRQALQQLPHFFY